MNMKMKRTLIALLTASVASSASAVADNQTALQAKADSANAKRGVEITGSIRAVAQRSSFDTDQDPTGINIMPDVERNEFVTADLNFGFRPFENVRANVMMRLGGGMQEYFAAAAKTLEAKWLNVEGNVGNYLYWVAGDFREEISPLTIYNPSIDIMYEPTVFARKRHMAQKEQLLEGNKRNLQGANIQFRKEINPSIGELRAEALFARVNRVSVLDFSGAEGNILPNDTTTSGFTLASNTDKFVAAGNFELLPLQKNVYVGLTPMFIFDNEKTKSYTYRHPDRNAKEFVPGDNDDPEYYNRYVRELVNPYEDSPQQTLVFSGRVGADVAGILNNKNLVLDLVAEYAMSMDKVKTATVTADPLTGAVSTGYAEENVNGSALLATLNAGYKVESWNAALALDFVRNDEKWFNNLAQSPSFFAQRILNSDKDGNTVKYGVNSPLYSTFDALYNYSPKFAAVERTLGTNDDNIRDGQSESYNAGIYNKNSWGSNVYSRAQLNLLSQLTDDAVQLALPFGLATPNRMGVRANIKGDWEQKVEAQILFDMFNQVKVASADVDKVSYMEYGAGLKVDIAKFIGSGYNKTAEIGGSYKHSEGTTTLLAGSATALAANATEGKVSSDFINVGLSAQFLPRLGFTAGLQLINSDYGKLSGVNASVGRDVPLMKSNQMQWMVGFDYVVGENAWLAINYGIVTVKNDYNTSAITTGRNLPDYYSAALGDGASGVYKHEFSQSIFEASINVEF